MIPGCPGAKLFKQPQPEELRCPSCSTQIEIWTDEIQAECPACHTKVLREMAASCLDWCSYAKACVGDDTYKAYMKNKSVTIKQKLLDALEGHFGKDTKRINHAKKVMQFAEDILKREEGQWHIVIPAAILHDAGIKVAEEKYGSSAGHHQEKEGPAIARKVLNAIGFQKKDTDEICEIIAHHHSPGEVTTENFKILYDADWLVNLKDEAGLDDKERLKKAIDKVFLTAAGREIACALYIGNGTVAPAGEKSIKGREKEV